MVIISLVQHKEKFFYLFEVSNKHSTCVKCPVAAEKPGLS